MSDDDKKGGPPPPPPFRIGPHVCLSIAMPPEAKDPPFIVRVGDIEKRIEGGEGTRFVIGRAAHCDLVLQGDDIDLEHVLVTRNGGFWAIKSIAMTGKADLLRNGEKVVPRRIVPPDDYTLGAHVLRFFCAE